MQLSRALSNEGESGQERSDPELWGAIGGAMGLSRDLAWTQGIPLRTELHRLLKPPHFTANTTEAPTCFVTNFYNVLTQIGRIQ